MSKPEITLEKLRAIDLALDQAEQLLSGLDAYAEQLAGPVSKDRQNVYKAVHALRVVRADVQRHTIRLARHVANSTQPA